MLLHASAVCLLHLLPKKVVRAKLVQHLSVGSYVFQPCFSGRNALFNLAADLRGNDDSAPVALVPDYVCNIVPKAFGLAGYKIVDYPTDVVLEPAWEHLARLVVDTKPRVLVGASIFGSSALLLDLKDPGKLSFLRSHGVQVVFDLAQDIRLRHRLPMGCGDFVHAVLSFNNKSFPGAMGGGVLSERSVPRLGEIPTSAGMCITLYKMVMLTYLSPLLKLYKSLSTGPSATVKQPYEHAPCEKFPYCIDKQASDPLKLQMILGYIGVKMIGLFAKKKATLLERGLHVRTLFSDSSPYLIMKRDVYNSNHKFLQHRFRKMPYALESNQDKSLRCEDVIIHNKGFADS